MLDKIAFISSFYPETNYSRYLSEELIRQIKKNNFEIEFYAEKNEKPLSCYHLKTWNKGLISIVDIAKKIIKQKPKLAHFQHEINMYGGTLSAFLFPFLVGLTKLLRIKILITIHAVPDLRLVDKEFIGFFRKNTNLIHPFVLRIFFKYLFFLLGIFSDLLIVHTETLKKTLTNDYKLESNKIKVISHGVDTHNLNLSKQKSNEKYFLYFGYLSKRKGILDILDGYSKFIKNNPVQEFKLILAGGVITGQEYAFEEIKSYIERLNIKEKVEITGFVDNAKIKQLFVNAYVVLVPAVISISASGPLAQAYSYNKCVIASKLGNFCEEVTNDYDGFLVEKSGWGDKLAYVVNNYQHVINIEQNVKNKALQRSWKNISALHLNLYKSLID